MYTYYVYMKTIIVLKTTIFSLVVGSDFKLLCPLGSKFSVDIKIENRCNTVKFC